MALKMTKEKVQDVIKEFGGSNKNTGSTEVQIALLTERINYLTDHLQVHKKDQHSKKGLLDMVSQRKRLLKYLQKKDEKKYQDIISRLDIRK